MPENEPLLSASDFDKATFNLLNECLNFNSNVHALQMMSSQKRSILDTTKYTGHDGF